MLGSAGMYHQAQLMWPWGSNPTPHYVRTQGGVGLGAYLRHQAQTQGLVHARQTLYLVSYMPSLIPLILFACAMVSLLIPGQPGSHSVDLAGTEFMDLLAQ